MKSIKHMSYVPSRYPFKRVWRGTFTDPTDGNEAQAQALGICGTKMFKLVKWVKYTYSI